MTTEARAETMSRRARLVYGGAAAVLVAIVVLTWSLGGFQRKARPLEMVSPASLIATGPYEFTFSAATAQRQPKTSYAPATWKVVVEGTGRTTGDETIRPSTLGDDGMFLARDPHTGEVQNAKSDKIGDGPANGFTPGLPAVPYRVEFTFSDAFRPGPTVRFVVVAQRFYDSSLIQTDDEDPSWRNDDHGYRVDLPVTVLPEQRS
jgi:hypothetical protein